MNRIGLITVFCAGMLLSFHHRACAQLETYKLYNISREEGLPTENVQQIFQDAYGFLWIASFDGLFRWDGYSYKKYFFDENDSTSISNNIVNVVYEDTQKRLWIGTLSGLDLYERDKDTFTRCDFTGTGRRIAVNAIVEDSKGAIWLGASTGLYCYDHTARHSPKYDAEGAPGKKLSDHVVFSLAIDKRDNIWIGTFHGGVNKLAIPTGKITTFQHKENDPRTVCSNMVNALMLDHQGQVWVGTYDKGISVLDPQGKVVKQYKIASNKYNIQNIVSALYEDQNHRIWVGAIMDHLFYLDTQQDRIVPFRNTAINRSDVACESVTHIGEDNVGNLWVGTQTEGMFYTNKYKNVFEYYTHGSRQKEHGLNGKIVTCFSESADGHVWIGTSGGLLLFNPADKTFKTYTTANGLSSNDVYDVQEDKHGNAWIAAWNGGLSKFDKSTQRFTSYIHDPAQKNSLNYNNIKSILVEDSIVWIGTHGEGLAVYDIRQNNFIHAGNNTVFPFDMALPAWINHLMRDSKNRLWISTYNGVFRYDRKALMHFTHASRVNTVSNNAVNMMLEDGKDRIWLVNEKGGIDLFDEQRQTFMPWLKAGHASKGFVLDDHGTLWISSGEGIHAADPNTKHTVLYDASDGLVANSFFHKAAMRSKTGHLYFGSTNGFNRFHPDSIHTVPYPARPYLTSLYVYDSLIQPNDKASPLKKVLSFTDTLSLTYEQAFFTIGFSTTNILSGGKTQFSYKLIGLHDKWIGLHGERKASFTELDPGEYTFRLRYTGANGEWLEAAKPLIIIISPPWWGTSWFKIFAATLIAGSIVLFFYIRLYAINRRTVVLEKEVSRRTHDLSEANFFLRERNAEIKRQSDKILLQQDQIVTQNHELEKSIEEARKLHRIKDRLFSILAHDLRNPIATLAGLSDKLRHTWRDLHAREIDRYADNIQKSSRGIYNLLTNLLQWAATYTKIGSRPTHVDLNKLIRNNAQLLEQQFEQKKISLNINVDHCVLADYNMLDTVIRNLLTNSVKFTYEGGKVYVDSKEIEEEILITISDNGMGMSRGQIENVFDVENQNVSKGTSGESGTGLGLIIAREFIEANKGSIALVSEVDKGTTFKIRLPKSIAAENKTDSRETVAPDSTKEFIEGLAIEDMVKLRGKKVLLVEDNQELRQYLKLFLSSTFEIFDAPNGKEGLQQAIELQPTAIISDLTMPVMDGIEFCKAVKANPDTSHIPFILLTSHSSDESQLSGYDAGADVYLTKPVRKRLLFQVILNFIENQEKIRQRILDTNGFLTNDPVINKSDQEFLDKIISIVEANLEDPALDYKTITEGVAMSKTVVYNKLKTITGQGIQEFIKTIRLKKSLKYLANGRISINEVAMRVGFNSQSYFNKCFLKQFNITPKAYMNKNRQTPVV